NEVLRVALAVAHADLGGLLGNRLVGEYPYPDAAAALDMARHRAPRGFQLARGQASAGRGLEPVLAEGDLVAARRHAGIAALLLLAVLGACRLQHAELSYSFVSPSGFFASPSSFS